MKKAQTLLRIHRKVSKERKPHLVSSLGSFLLRYRGWAYKMSWNTSSTQVFAEHLQCARPCPKCRGTAMSKKIYILGPRGNA